MTTEQRREEWDYRYTERLAILCANNPPTRDQINLAAKEADEWEERWKKDNQSE